MPYSHMPCTTYDTADDARRLNAYRADLTPANEVTLVCRRHTTVLAVALADGEPVCETCWRAWRQWRASRP